ncbi:MAG: carbohydrate kinase family protein [Candidatus Paceibacterota bacterium]
MSKLDFLAVGDITTDDFIKLEDVRIDTDKDPGDKGMEELCFRFGDKIEYADHDIVAAVGNAPNAGVSAHRLDLETGLNTNFGDDMVGEMNSKQLEKEGINMDYVNIHEGKKSNYHYVLRHGPERTILVKHYDYDYKLPDFSEGEAPRFMYLSSLGENSFDHHIEIAEFAENNDTKLAFQPGTFQIKMGYDKLTRLYEASYLYFSNKEEAQLVLDNNTDDMEELLRDMHDHGPDIAVITDGPEGAYVFDGTEGWHMPMYPDPKPPVDRTGAGDSFSSTFTAALALGKDIPTALRWGPVNSMSVVQDIGAQAGLVSQEELLEHLENAPDDYEPKQIF